MQVELQLGSRTELSDTIMQKESGLAFDLLTLRYLHTTKAEYVLEKNGMRRKSAPHKSSCHVAAAAVARQVAKVRWEEHTSPEPDPGLI